MPLEALSRIIGVSLAPASSDNTTDQASHGRWQRLLSLRVRLVVLAVGLTLIVTLGAAAMAWWVIGEYLLSNEEVALERTANGLGVQFEAQVAGYMRDARMLASTDAIAGFYRAASAGGTDPMTGKSMEAWYSYIFDGISYPVFTTRPEYRALALRSLAGGNQNLLYVERDPERTGQLRTSSLPAKDGAEWPKEPLSGYPMDRDAEFLSLVVLPVQTDSSADTPMSLLRITVPVIAAGKGRILGSLQLDISLHALIESFDNVAASRRSIRMIDAAGNDIFDSGGTDSWNVSTEYPTFDQIFDRRTGRREHARLENATGAVHVLGLYNTHIAGIDGDAAFRVLVTNDLSAVLSVVSVGYKKLLPAMMVLLMMCLLISALFANGISQSLHRLIEYISSWTPERRIDQATLSRTDEIGSLARKFDRLLRLVADQHRQLQATIEQGKAAHQRASAMEVRLRSVVDAMLDGLVIIDDHGTIIFVNAAIETITGYSAKDLQNHPVTKLTYIFHDERLIRRAAARRSEMNCVVLRVSEAFITSKTGERVEVSLVVSRLALEGRLFFSVVVHDRRQQHVLEAELRRFKLCIEQASDAVTIQDARGRLIYINPAFEKMVEKPASEIYGRMPQDFLSNVDGSGGNVDRREALERKSVWHGTYHLLLPSGGSVVLDAWISALRDSEGAITHFSSVMRDITKQRIMEREQARAHKLEAIGQLAAGVAHEINTPAQYLGDNLSFLRDGMACLIAAMQEIQKRAIDDQQLAADLQAIDIPFLREEMPRAIEQSIDGCRRITTIVQAMKEFSYPEGNRSAADLNSAIRSTILVATNEWKYVAEVRTELDPRLPPVWCHVGEINQVILNMLINAAHAIADGQGDNGNAKGVITVSTELVDQQVEIRIRDSGIGIPRHLRYRIFDPFFTTKGVGKGTGQGLAIAHDVVVRRHHGTIRVESEKDKGSTFIISLPVEEVMAEDEHREAMFSEAER
ncbi:MAG: PAS domain S-box protein [Gammaproteobacteria bacterium]|nr:PAS domain S-box protein [Gammaproteobacteria bacterium]